jgi:hypothetical protein
MINLFLYTSLLTLPSNQPTLWGQDPKVHHRIYKSPPLVPIPRPRSKSHISFPVLRSCQLISPFPRLLNNS